MMRVLTLKRNLAVLAFFGIIFLKASYAGIVISPSALFLNSGHRMISITATNEGDDEREIWTEMKFGYETSTDSGKIFIYMDSLAHDELSAAAWLQCYPKRFTLRPGESQTIRVMAVPPAGISDGEYWARVILNSKTRQVIQPKNAQVNGTKPALTILYQQSVPFHYRVGRVTTGLKVDSLITALSDTSVDVYLRISRTGNASFWGSRTLELRDKNGTVVYKVTRNSGVYKKITTVDHINRGGITSGDYTLSVLFASEARTDIPKKQLLQTQQVRASTSITIP